MLPPDMTISIGSPAPDFRARDSNDNPVQLSDFRGKYLVLYFYPRAFTRGCTAETARFRDNYDDIKALGAEVVGVSADTHETQCRFADSMQVKFPLIADDDGHLTKLYGAKRSWLPLNKRLTFIIDPQGMVAARFDHEFQVSRHLDDVVRFLRERRTASGAKGTEFSSQGASA